MHGILESRCLLGEGGRGKGRGRQRGKERKEEKVKEGHKREERAGEKRGGGGEVRGRASEGRFVRVQHTWELKHSQGNKKNIIT